MSKKTSHIKPKPKCEMCGNEALPFSSLCELHWEVRITEQTRGRNYINTLIRPSGTDNKRAN